MNKRRTIRRSSEKKFIKFKEKIERRTLERSISLLLSRYRPEIINIMYRERMRYGIRIEEGRLDEVTGLEDGTTG